MMGKIDLNQIERNIFHGIFQDGLVDMLFGLYFALTGLALATDVSIAIAIVLMMFFTPLLLGLKKRFTYPRTGYVELRQGDPQPLPWLILGSAIVGLIALVAVLIVVGSIAHPGEWYRWMPILFGILWAGIFLGLGLNARMLRYYIVAGLALIGGPAVTLVTLSGKLAHLGLFFAALGVVMLSWGVIIFYRFLRKNPIVTEEAADAID